MVTTPERPDASPQPAEASPERRTEPDLPRCPTCGRTLPASMTGGPGNPRHEHGRPRFAPLWSPGPARPDPDAHGLLR
ncbi:hypothetical protein G7070_07095 [Propioniciclava coleopterorum]|uniref:Uncharacterized protein n=1 Tax=Propioniciclava coleopterorum TaxID=2714937 RepID=A0A6G7Y630_9ACTN|nr:hypothetical protein [Propioniciclava coleopterorum]QIK72077.1 hypothetical protein G7070_07095 [Propioniciclava coleopterorum]